MKNAPSPIRSALAAALLGTLAFSTLALDLQAHRGGRGLRPENTLPAFENALALGVDTLELDVGVTADGVVVISHDPYINPLIARDAKGQWLEGEKGPLIKSLTLAQLQAYELGRIKPGTPYAKQFETQEPRDGTRFSTLAELFDHTKKLGANTVRFNIETKINPTQPDDTVSAEAMTNALLKVIRDAGMASRVTIQSFDWRTLQLVQKVAPSMTTVYLTFQNANNDTVKDGLWTAGYKIAEHGSVPKLVKAAGGTVWSPNGGAVTEALVKEAQGLGLKVVVWTINNPAELDRFIAWGVNGLITDYPDRLREVMAARKLPLPKPVKAP
ncbi:MAG: glycerophosphodiester phosphodiesterase [Burkholderiales bacterium]|nr:glycerophosphodiester phosphodiesterase [Burkholderiales bacterium]